MDILGAKFEDGHRGTSSFENISKKLGLDLIYMTTPCFGRLFLVCNFDVLE